jgi:hypothetical protein
MVVEINRLINFSCLVEKTTVAFLNRAGVQSRPCYSCLLKTIKVISDLMNYFVSQEVIVSSCRILHKIIDLNHNIFKTDRNMPIIAEITHLHQICLQTDIRMPYISQKLENGWSKGPITWNMNINKKVSTFI